MKKFDNAMEWLVLAHVAVVAAALLAGAVLVAVGN